MRIRELLELAVKYRASDLYLNVPSVPLMRIDGELYPVQNVNPFSLKDVEALFEEITSTERRAAFAIEHEFDFTEAGRDNQGISLPAHHDAGGLESPLRVLRE
jgi:Tfp pilus assembly pilus retraction ATPase PilT